MSKVTQQGPLETGTPSSFVDMHFPHQGPSLALTVSQAPAQDSQTGQRKEKVSLGVLTPPFPGCPQSHMHAHTLPPHPRTYPPHIQTTFTGTYPPMHACALPHPSCFQHILPGRGSP